MLDFPGLRISGGNNMQKKTKKSAVSGQVAIDDSHEDVRYAQICQQQRSQNLSVVMLIVYGMAGNPRTITGSPRTEPRTGNRTVLEPEPAEPAIKTEPDEPEPISNSFDPEPEPIRTGSDFPKV